MSRCGLWRLSLCPVYGLYKAADPHLVCHCAACSGFLHSHPLVCGSNVWGRGFRRSGVGWVLTAAVIFRARVTSAGATSVFPSSGCPRGLLGNPCVFSVLVTSCLSNQGGRDGRWAISLDGGVIILLMPCVQGRAQPVGKLLTPDASQPMEGRLVSDTTCRGGGKVLEVQTRVHHGAF